MVSARRDALATYFLTRRGRVFVEASGATQPAGVMQAVELELAAVGYVASYQLLARLATLPDAELAATTRWLTETLYAFRTAGGKGAPLAAASFTPLFRGFPHDVPADTYALWWQRVLAFCFGGTRQPCPTCGQKGTSHLLEPCHHVVCDRCFDGRNYAGCPICGRRTAGPASFFEPSARDRAAIPREQVAYVRIDLEETDLDATARKLFAALAARSQPLSPADRDGLRAITQTYREGLLEHLPPRIPLRENVAAIFGDLLASCAPDRVLPVAERYVKTATDVLRLLVAFSGGDASLAPALRWKIVEEGEPIERWRGPLRERLERARAEGGRAEDDADPWRHAVYATMASKRWRMARLPRPMRRAVLALLDRIPFQTLADDMLRHRSRWTWVSSFLHPHEHAKRFPDAARAFRLLHGKDPEGNRAPRHRTWTARVEGALERGELEEAVALLEERPGELARRFDRLLRLASARAATDPNACSPVVASFERVANKLPTPLLVALAGHLPSRVKPLPARVFFPKSMVALGTGADSRPPLRADVVTPALHAVVTSLLARFAKHPPFEAALLDERLRDVIAPFGERNASPAAVALPRGSRVPLPSSKALRLFLHWCQPEKGRRTDVDLSVVFFDASWNLAGVCSFYELTLRHSGAVVAKSSGDWTAAPWPDGASEYIDLDRAAARAAGMRYAMMVVTAYEGMPFSQLARAFAGVMLRDDLEGATFDPRTVALRFNLGGDNGVFVPAVVDLADDVLLWLDAYAKGAFSMNSVPGAKSVLARLGDAFDGYFAAGARASMWDLARWHAAARTRRVHVRGAAGGRRFDRADGETAAAFAARIDRGVHDAEEPAPEDRPLLAALFTGDVVLPEGSESYVLFPELVHGSIAGADWLV